MNRPNPPQSATVSNSPPATVAFLNEYTVVPPVTPDPTDPPVPPVPPDPTDPNIPENHPAVTINKVFHGIRDSEIPGGFRIVMTGPGGFTGTVSLSDAMSATGGVFTNLTAGAYSINEENNNVPGFNYTANINGSPVTLPYTFQITNDTGHIMITIDNDYVAEPPPLPPEQSPRTGVSRSVIIPAALLSLGAVCFALAGVVRRRLNQ